MNRYFFFKEDTNVIKHYMTEKLASLIIREMQIKVRIRYHPTPVNIAIIKKTRITSFSGMLNTGNSYTLLIGM